ncbi:hypothetical protein [Streptomyces sp. NPDC006879]|uniref:hypothetical protein n=1 Tax=Streptomyces sp. NPDC006879 TaxID=3364767 RepID=UPI0036B9F2B7
MLDFLRKNGVGRASLAVIGNDIEYSDKAVNGLAYVVGRHKVIAKQLDREKAVSIKNGVRVGYDIRAVQVEGVPCIGLQEISGHREFQSKKKRPPAVAMTAKGRTN